MPIDKAALLQQTPLTEEEIRCLQPGDRIVVIWRGGVGPCEYGITLHGKGVFASLGKHMVDDLLYCWQLNKVWKIEGMETE